jgi:hypothetical protein
MVLSDEVQTLSQEWQLIHSDLWNITLGSLVDDSGLWHH